MSREHRASQSAVAGGAVGVCARGDRDRRAAGVPGRSDRARRSGAIVGDTVVEQFEPALGNLLTALAAAGGQPTDLASLTVYAVDLADYRAHGREIGAVWRQLAGRTYPAMAAIGVSRLWDEAALVEVQGFAVIG